MDDNVTISVLVSILDTRYSTLIGSISKNWYRPTLKPMIHGSTFVEQQMLQLLFNYHVTLNAENTVHHVESCWRNVGNKYH